jgi:hypothetical protein
VDAGAAGAGVEVDALSLLGLALLFDLESVLGFESLLLLLESPEDLGLALP